MRTVTTLESDPAASIAASEAEVALADGDTARAREQFTLAGDLLKSEAESIRDSMRRNEQLFLAASQYFHGGEYEQARHLCGRIQPHLLSSISRSAYSRFLMDVKERSRPEYAQEIKDQLLKLHSARRFEAILSLLKIHPFVLRPGQLAYYRADCCEEIGDYRAAALFLSDALRIGDAPFSPHCFAAGAILTLGIRSRDKAWEFAKHLMELLPHSLIDLSASLTCYHQASAASEADRPQLLNQQLELFATGRQIVLNDFTNALELAHVNYLVSLAYQAAALTLMRFSRLDDARELAEFAVSLMPTNPYAAAVRDLILSGDEIAPLSAEAAIQTQQRRIADSLSKRPDLHSISA